MQELSPAVNTKAILHEQRRLLPCHHSVSAIDSCLSHGDKLLTLEKLTGMRIEFMVMTMAFQGLLNMLSPSKKVYKHYIATLDKPLGDDVKKRFEDGIVLADGTVCQKAFFEKLSDNIALVQICEGKFHQVKKMFSACSYIVEELKRVRIGDLELDPNLEEGKARELTKCEKQLVFTGKND